MRLIEKRLLALERAQGGIAQEMPTEIWIVAAGQPETRALLWRAAHAINDQDRDSAISGLADQLEKPRLEVEQSVDDFQRILAEVRAKDDC